MFPKEIIGRFDVFLSQRNLAFEAVIIGGAALGLLGIVSRQTRDCDVLEPAVPDEIQTAARDFAKQIQHEGGVLKEDWFNNGPSSLLDVLPSDWKNHLQLVFSGQALKLYTLGRLDLLRSKLFALCDRGLDLPDCIALKPTEDELSVILPWLKQQDGNLGWPDHVQETLETLRQRLRHGI